MYLVASEKMSQRKTIFSQQKKYSLFLKIIFHTKCKYVVWISYSGLGNKVLTLTSAFLDVNPVKNNETQQRKGTQDRSMDRFK